MAGLLDGLNSDGAMLGLSLLAAAGPSATPMSFGQRLYGALQQDQSRRTDAEDRKQRKMMQELQMQQLLAQAAEQKRMRENEEKFRGLISSPQMSSAQDALAGGGGPTVANAAQMKPVDPNQQLLFEAMRLGQIKPMDYVSATTPKTKAPEYKVVGGRLVRIQGDDVREAYAAPDKPDLNSLIVMGPDGKPTVNSLLLDAKRQIAKAGATNLGVSYGAPVAGIGPDGNPVYIQPDKMGGAPAIIPGVRPPKSAAEERAESEQATRARQGKQMQEALAAAEAILKQGRTTASGIGNVVDAGARAVGVTTPGAQDSARLQALSGWLVANVPRMEGPQSNFDVQNYTTMAGKVGDPTVPIKERLAALETVRRLQQRYASINGVPQQSQNAGSQSLDDLLNKYGN